MLNVTWKVFNVLCGLLFSSVVLANTTLSIEHWDLKNKAHVYFVKRTEVPTLDIELVFSAGSSFDGAHSGLAALANTMIGEGAGTMSTDMVAHAFESVGAQFQSFLNRDMAGVTLRTLIDKKYLNQALETLKIVMQQPTFSNNTLKRIKQQMIARIKVQQQDPWQLANNRLYELLYRNKPYAHNPFGSIQQMQGFTINQVKQFYRRYYTGVNADIILVGDVAKAQAKIIAKQIAGDLPTGKPAQKLRLATQLKAPEKSHVVYPSKQTTIMLGQVGITRNNQDYFPLMVGNAILGGLPMSSILFKEIRDKEGLAYFATSGFESLKYRGPFVIALQTKAKSTDKAVGLTKSILENFIKSGPTQSQLDAAKKNMIGRFPLTISTNKNILGIVANIAFYHRPLNYLDTYRGFIQSVTTDAIKNAFQKLIHLNRMALITVGPTQAKKSS